LKISIIIPSNNDHAYLDRLLFFLKENTAKENLEEIIVVNSFEEDNLIKIAEKAHAKLFVFQNSTHRLKAEAGAFEAKGEILYFIKPGHFPPPYFSNRIIDAVKLKKELGSIYHPWIGSICRFLNLQSVDKLVMFFLPMTNLFVQRKIYFKAGGLKYDGKTLSFGRFIKKKQFRFSTGIVQ
jgi:glycosyltransferase involved in cell wall biosynthesis